MARKDLKNFVKICDNCGITFACDFACAVRAFKNYMRNTNFDVERERIISCPSCGAQYYAVNNFLNGFPYLEFAGMPDDYLMERMEREDSA